MECRERRWATASQGPAAPCRDRRSHARIRPVALQSTLLRNSPYQQSLRICRVHSLKRQKCGRRKQEGRRTTTCVARCRPAPEASALPDSLGSWLTTFGILKIFYADQAVTMAGRSIRARFLRLAHVRNSPTQQLRAAALVSFIVYEHFVPSILKRG